ncbi:ribonuclease D [uncultured Gulosibacter sp.]|uniref:ribonuclease D n=1 Tax=uncultured Gulosibacter sp. TaxID=1339167 RepID=UPI00288C5CC8|nr:ribonuclease D [uncultured Gulosibacter sp.]
MVALDAKRLDEGELQVIDTPEALDAAIARIAAGSGAIAVDTERAAGYRYSDRAYLVQLFRRGSGTLLIDPIPFGSLAQLGEVINSEPWVLHAATQDLPSLREIGLDPQEIFDTELASRLLGKARVGLGAVVEELLGIELAKAHSASDWSLRPLPDKWLVYAALDVELLLDVKDRLTIELRETGKSEWASEEFADILKRELRPKREEPWRRLSGIHTIHRPRQLAVARELWLARDAFACETDTAPSRVVPDRALIEAVKAMPRTKQQLAALPSFTGAKSRAQLDLWWEAIERGRTTDSLPERQSRPKDAMPAPRAWAQKRPEADARLKTAKPAVAARAQQLSLPTENLLTPAILRRVAWEPAGNSEAAIAEQLRALGARNWQCAITAPVIWDAFVASRQDVEESVAQES